MTTTVTETAISAALKKAGVPLAENRLRLMALDAMRKHHNNVDRALPTFTNMIGDDEELIVEALRFYLESLASADQVVVADRNRNVGARQSNDAADGHHCNAQDGLRKHASAASPLADGEGQFPIDAQASVAAPVREPNAVEIAAAVAAKKESAKSVFDRFTTRTGQAWGNVWYRDLDSLFDDGETAMVVKEYIGHLRGDQRHKSVRELMTPTQFAAAMRKAERLRKVRLGNVA